MNTQTTGADGGADQPVDGGSERPADAAAVPERQWEMPVGFDETGQRLVTLREAAAQGTRLFPVERLTADQRAELVVRRILAQNRFRLAMYGEGVIETMRAVREVANGTEIGGMLSEVEFYMIAEMLKLVRRDGDQPSPAEGGEARPYAKP